MAEIRWTDEAVAWLEDIHTYIARSDPIAAGKVVAGIHDNVQVLVRFPRIGFVYRSEPQPEVRVLLYGHYRIAYIVDGDNHVDILGVFHGALDIDRYLQARTTAGPVVPT